MYISTRPVTAVKRRAWSTCSSSIPSPNASLPGTRPWFAALFLAWPVQPRRRPPLARTSRSRFHQFSHASLVSFVTACGSLEMPFVSMVRRWCIAPSCQWSSRRCGSPCVCSSGIAIATFSLSHGWLVVFWVMSRQTALSPFLQVFLNVVPSCLLWHARGSP